MSSAGLARANYHLDCSARTNLTATASTTPQCSSTPSGLPSHLAPSAASCCSLAAVVAARIFQRRCAGWWSWSPTRTRPRQSGGRGGGAASGAEAWPGAHQGVRCLDQPVRLRRLARKERQGRVPAADRAGVQRRGGRNRRRRLDARAPGPARRRLPRQRHLRRLRGLQRLAARGARITSSLYSDEHPRGCVLRCNQP